MHRVLLASCAAATLLTSTANAADLSEPTGYDWTGFYLGVNGGYAFDGDDKIGLTFATRGTGISVSDATVGSIDLSGIVGGVQAGYNHQIDSFVLGVVGDVQIGGLSESSSSSFADDLIAPAGEYHSSSDVDFFGTLRARMGFAFDRIFFYGTGGLAWANADFELRGEGLGGELFRIEDSSTQVGWTVGAGAEYAVHDSVTLGLEYLYVDLGSETLKSPVAGTKADLDVSTNIETNFNLIRATLNWKF
jgi:outer membrane immunogenic protein